MSGLVTSVARVDVQIFLKDTVHIKEMEAIVCPTQTHIFFGKNLEISCMHTFRLEIKPSSGKYVGIKVRNTKKHMDNVKKTELYLMEYRVKRDSAPPSLNLAIR